MLKLQMIPDKADNSPALPWSHPSQVEKVKEQARSATVAPWKEDSGITRRSSVLEGLGGTL